VDKAINEANDDRRPLTSEADRYTRRSILRSEEIYGQDFQSPGGKETVGSICRRAQMRWGMAILDIGSGLGGACFYFAQKYGATVVGIDASAAMVSMSTERAARKRIAGVSFRLGDIRTAPIEGNTYDLAWSRDSILYIAEKNQVWQNVHGCLKPGGQLIVTDFCRGRAYASDAFEGYVSRCHYHLEEIDRYRASMAAAGYEISVAEDITTSLIALLRMERESFRARRAEFCARYGPDDFDYLHDRWSKKIAFCEGGDLKWGLFVAKKRA
jgi:phosphoethanolamine N-methyltransferase